MTSRHHRVDRSLREPRWSIRLLTLAILLGGAGVVLYAILRPEARRERAAGGLAVGDTVTRVVERLGEPPHVCRVGSLAHLTGQFPPGWPAAAQERAAERLRESTAERWVYPLGEPRGDPCGATLQRTEIGVGTDRRILWIVPLAGRHPLQLPDTLLPGMLTDTTPDIDA